MDQIKIGRFIAERRKMNNMTQLQLAAKLNVTDRAVSKWENGKSMPDSSIMLDLCGELKISVNDLLSGEVVTVNDYNEKLEKNILEMAKQKETADKKLLSLEILIGVLSVIILLGFTFVASFVDMPAWLRITLIAFGLAVGIVGIMFALTIEQSAGYYSCKKCGFRYVPKYSSVLWAMHAGRTRYMRCPKCNEKSWQKKVLNKEEK
ncbi:MAG: helix-turn-helix domain-containing protein [Clostridia bacterium]|nr:helix-turn-helix domain-containing protein [Clostridia bacterium]